MSAEATSQRAVVNNPNNQTLFCQCSSCGGNQAFDIAQMGTSLSCKSCHFPIQLQGEQNDAVVMDHIPDKQLSPEDGHQRTLEVLQEDNANNRSKPEPEC
jgi:hypothetical protein